MQEKASPVVVLREKSGREERERERKRGIAGGGSEIVRKLLARRRSYPFLKVSADTRVVLPRRSFRNCVLWLFILLRGCFSDERFAKEFVLLLTSRGWSRRWLRSFGSQQLVLREHESACSRSSFYTPPSY